MCARARVHVFRSPCVSSCALRVHMDATAHHASNPCLADANADPSPCFTESTGNNSPDVPMPRACTVRAASPPLPPSSTVASPSACPGDALRSSAPTSAPLEGSSSTPRSENCRSGGERDKEEEEDAGAKPDDEIITLERDAASVPHANRHPDGMREIRAMALAALPFPPLPVMACREIEGECSFVEAELQSCSSHDLLAHLMNVSCKHGTEHMALDRAAYQAAAQAELFAKVDAWHASADEANRAKVDAKDRVHLPPPQWSYEALCTATRLYVQAYMADPKKPQDVRFLPMTDIDMGHFIRRKAVQFQNAQDILYGPCKYLRERCTQRAYERMSYAELVQVSIARILDSRQAE